MPRLTNSSYLFQARRIRDAWQNNKHAFTLVSSRDQQYLHAFFQPSRDLTDAEQIAHRVAITAKQPALTACAGRALRHLAKPEPLRLARTGSVVVYPLLRPEPDLDRMAKALLGLACEQLRREVADQD